MHIVRHCEIFEEIIHSAEDIIVEYYQKHSDKQWYSTASSAVTNGGYSLLKYLPSVQYSYVAVIAECTTYCYQYWQCVFVMKCTSCMCYSSSTVEMM